MKIVLITTDGQEHHHDIERQGAIETIQKLIGADFLTTVNLRNGKVMLLDDSGNSNGLRVNEQGTILYNSVCRPGTTHQIVGDVVIVTDADFE